MTSSSRRTEYDAIVIGSGQGGSPLAEAMARSGWRTALIEREAVGGTCINVGCTPTKTMVASARVAHLARRSAEYGVHTGSVRVHLAEVVRRKRSVVESFRSGKQSRLERTEGLDLIFGEASFEGSARVIVKGREGEEIRLSSRRIFVNTGCRPFRPPIPGLESVAVLDSSSIMELEEAPEHLIVLGGGYIGLEFGQMFRRFGSRVTIVQRGEALLTREDADIAEAVAEILREDGVDVRLGAEAREIRRAGDGSGVEVQLLSSQPQPVLKGSHLLVATGRVPNTDALALEAAGVETDERGYVKVNERLEATAPGIWALGDVKGGPAFTHISYDDYRILRANLLEKGSASTRGRHVPYTVFIDPQLGRVGSSEAEAAGRGLKVKVARLPMSKVARAIEVGETRGFIKAIVDTETDRIAGCAVLGIEGGELMSALQVAMMGGLTATALRDATFAHPVLAECLNNLFAA